MMGGSINVERQTWSMRKSFLPPTPIFCHVKRNVLELLIHSTLFLNQVIPPFYLTLSFVLTHSLFNSLGLGLQPFTSFHSLFRSFFFPMPLYSLSPPPLSFISFSPLCIFEQSLYQLTQSSKKFKHVISSTPILR